MRHERIFESALADVRYLCGHPRRFADLTKAERKAMREEYEARLAAQ
jgi:hypothetical protein